MKNLMIPEDKANHFIYGLFLSVLFNFFFGIEVAFYAILTVAVLKEVSDWYQNHKLKLQHKPEVHGVDFWDAVSTLLGFGTLALLKFSGV